MSLKSRARWVSLHGIARVVIGRAYRRGDLHARILADPAARANPYPTYDEIRARGPLVKGRLMMQAVSHPAVTSILRSDAFAVGFDPETMPWISRKLLQRVAADERIVGPIDPPSLLVTNPPDHTRYRRLVSRVFTAKAVEALRGRIEERTTELLDALEDREPVDLVAEYASLLPVTVIAEILGVPLEMRQTFLRWGTLAAPVLDVGLTYQQFEESEAALEQMSDWMYAHFDSLRRTPGDDIVSKLVHLDDESGKLDDRELLAIAGLLLAAGFETTVNLLGTGAVLLMRHPEQRDALAADPGLWSNAVDEMLRYEAPVQATSRRALRDTEICGVTVREGSFVTAMIGGANRDPDVFEDPDRFDVRRPNAREHLAFSSGAHYCIGASLARLEGEIGLRRLFERFPDLSLAGELHQRPTRTLRGYDRIPVTLTARRSTPTRAAGPGRTP
ncbi:cytochrome P450 [Cryptosporangium arvum]|uniref:cytochrome P450 n=1 Tax=Cryptosporangium arvum TaxID=80871 RepID=UPI000569CB13|nr:cytochrome P450 [Cryptosporangium arvum]